MRSEEKRYNDRAKRALLALIKICFSDGTLNYRAYNKKYMHGSCRQGFFAFKVGDTFLEKWVGGNITPYRVTKSYMDYNDAWGRRGGPKMFIEISNPEFLATVEVKVTGGDQRPHYLSGIKPPDNTLIAPIIFLIQYCEFVGDIDVLENEALLANLSHDFGG